MQTILFTNRKGENSEYEADEYAPSRYEWEFTVRDTAERNVVMRITGQCFHRHRRAMKIYEHHAIPVFSSDLMKYCTSSSYSLLFNIKVSEQ